MKDQFDHKKESHRSCRSFLKTNGINLLTDYLFSKIDGINLLMVNLFKRLMRVIQSRSIFLKDQREWFDHGQSYLKIKKIERSKIKDRKIEFPILPLPILLYNLTMAATLRACICWRTMSSCIRGAIFKVIFFTIFLTIFTIFFFQESLKNCKLSCSVYFYNYILVQILQTASF